ncbi:MAG: pseudouridylate synthase [Bdellovibrionales bacterium]|nr:pseudouridylate synthase [Bdellovibrionales bacterium]
MKIRAVYRSKDFLVVHKPAGLVVYADRPEDRGVVDLLARQLGKSKVYPVHRLDKPTCGLLAVALTPEAAHRWSAIFRGRAVRKAYLAIVHGEPPVESVVDVSLPRNKDRAMEEAKTQFKRLATCEVEVAGERRSYSLVRCEPRTGRYHQIRRHLKAQGHPILGDEEYGNSWDNREMGKAFGVRRCLLSATHLWFRDPFTGESVALKDRPDRDFQSLAERLGWKLP